VIGIHSDIRQGYSDGMSQRIQQIGWFAALAIVAAVLAWGAAKVIPLRRYNLRSQSINAKICALQERRPVNVSEKLWEDCIAWTSIAHCNVCFSEGHTKYEAMLRYEQDLDEKLKGQVDLDTLKWIGARLEKSGPHGQHYFVKVKWWEQWESTLRANAN
jgi:hypothetical protein